MVEGYRNELEQFNLECWALTAESFFAHLRMDLALQALRLYRRLRIHLFRIGRSDARSRQPRRRSSRSRASRSSSTRSTLPDALGVGQVLVKVLYTTICGAQINEIEAPKGPDKFLPHLLGHEASAHGDRDRAGRHQREAGRHRRAALAAEPGHPVPAAGLSMARQEAQCRLGDDLQRICRRLREPHDGDPARLSTSRSRRCSAAR